MTPLASNIKTNHKSKIYKPKNDHSTKLDTDATFYILIHGHVLQQHNNNRLTGFGPETACHQSQSAAGFCAQISSWTCVNKT